MSKSFCPSWLKLDQSSIEMNSSKNVETNSEELLPKPPPYPKDSLKKFLELNGLRPMNHSPEYMKWSKEHVEPYCNYWRQVCNKYSPPIKKSENIDYDLYKDRFTESEYNFEYNNEYDDELDIYEPYDVTDFVENMDVFEEQYQDEHIPSETDDETSDDDEYEDYYDYRHSKYYL